MNTTIVSFNGQDYEVPVSAMGTAKGNDIIRAVGVGPGQTVYRANEDGHEVIQPSDDVAVRPGEQFNATPRFITAARNIPRINQELTFLVQSYGDNSVRWAANLEWVVLYGYKLPKGYNRSATDIAVMIPDNYGNGAPLRDCFVDPDLRYLLNGNWVEIGHYFDAPDAYAPPAYKAWRDKNWSYLCLHMEEWKPQHTFFTYLSLVFTYLSNPFYAWEGNEAQAQRA